MPVVDLIALCSCLGFQRDLPVRWRIGYFAEWTPLAAHAHLVRLGSSDTPSCVHTTGKFQHFGFLGALHMGQALIIAKIAWKYLPPLFWCSPNPFGSRMRRLKAEVLP